MEIVGRVRPDDRNPTAERKVGFPHSGTRREEAANPTCLNLILVSQFYETQ